MRRLLLPAAAIAAGAVIVPPSNARGDGAPIDSLLLARSVPLTWDGDAPGGPGFDVLVEAARDARFVLLAEEHNLREVNLLAGALFDRLHDESGLEHLVLETGSVIGGWLDAAATAGYDSVAALVRRYPHAPTFATDEELKLIARVRSLSRAQGPAVWGVDQELAAMHLLERLAELSPEARPDLLRLADEARPHEATRTGDVHYLSQVARREDYEALVPLVDAKAGTEAADLLDALLRTVRIYTGHRQPLGAYDSGRLREESMRARFLERYREAALEGVPPRALVKMGHWHLFRGIFRGDVPTFGNFLCELAAAEGGQAVIIATYVAASPDGWRNARGTLARIADPEGTLVVDLRPLRPAVHSGQTDAEGLRDVVFRADLLVIIGGGRTGTYSVAYGTPPGE